MREIKFRAWNIEKREMYYQDNFQWFAISGRSDWLMWYGAGKPEKLLAGCGKKDILMQYTGLKDKNGKEIYEGDILQFEYDGEMHITGAVKWREEVAIWATDIGIGLTTIEPEDAWVPGAYEIAGNIYENPELLEDDK